jgi:mono/diheme cytochrome c family protein
MKRITFRSLPSMRTAFAIVMLNALVAACGGGAPTVQNPVISTPPPAGYSGPPPASQDVQAFKVNVWDNLSGANRCGSCHGAGGQSPQFARGDDVNLAYQAANTVVTLADPAGSPMVAKVGGGHNCWLANDSACADQLTVWIRNWAGATVGGTRQIQLVAPPLREVGASKSFPGNSSAFASTVYPLLTEYCSRCHASSATTPQSPFFAEGNPDVAYAAARPKINLDAPEQSRLVLRLRNEFHNCWDDCAQNATEMEQAIRSFADQIPLSQIDPGLVLSKALALYDGTVASGGSRHDSALVALYEFKTGTGTVGYDTSGVEPALNLTMSGDVSWVGGWGVNVRGGKLQGPTAASRKLHDLITASGEYSIEAWVAPANVVQENAYIVSYSGGTSARNFTLGQTMYDYDFFQRSSGTDANGAPQLSTPSADEVLQATLQHVVATYDPVAGRKLFVNGELVSNADPQAGGTLADWNDTFALVLGNEVSSDRQWQGVIRLVAVHNRALNPEQIRQNFDAGVGERFYLLFSVAHLIGVEQSYVMFEVSQFDSYAYLFDKPVFISLDENARPDGLRIRGLRIGINGAEAKVGQAYIPIDVVVNASGYDPASGFPLSGVGTTIALDKGPALDQFFLTFEQLGEQSNVRTEPAPLLPPPPPDGAPLPEIGLRTFEEIAASMAVMTGVPAGDPAVAETYDRVREQLPTVENIEGFLSSHQVGVAQLAIEFCNSLVDDPARRSGYFAGFDFSAPAAQAFDTPAKRDLVVNPLVARAVGSGIASQPSSAEVRSEIDDLITRLTACGAGCAPDRTATVVKSACAAVIGGASTLLQ